MAEFYNVCNKKYKYLCEQNTREIRVKLDVLDWNENTTESIETSIINTDGSINVSYQQGTRRTCNLTIIDRYIKFLPSINSPFWHNKKFKLYIGIVCGRDVYYWSQGVYLINSVTVNNHTLNIEGVDKFALFDGTFNLMKADVDYKALAVNSNSIWGLIQETLLLDSGKGVIVDPIQPIIDFEYKGKLLEADIILDSGQFIGELLINLANFYGADIYYDTDGHLIFHRMFGDNRVSAYQYSPTQWHFNNNNSIFLSQDVNFEFSGHNRIKVFAEGNQEYYEYTAINTNPASDLNTSAVGVRSLDDEEITLTDGMGVDECRQQAEYLLSKECRTSISSNIICAILPHLDVNQIIAVTNEYLKHDAEKFIVNNITMSLGNQPMTLNVTNLQVLPDFICNVPI